MDCRLPGSSVHGILQARILEWVAISFSRESTYLGDRTQVSCTAGRLFTTEPLGKLEKGREGFLTELNLISILKQVSDFCLFARM